MCLVVPCEAEIRLRALAHDRNVPPPPSYLSVPVTTLRALVLDHMPRWHVHTIQVAYGKGPPPPLAPPLRARKSVCT